MVKITLWQTHSPTVGSVYQLQGHVLINVFFQSPWCCIWLTDYLFVAAGETNPNPCSTLLLVFQLLGGWRLVSTSREHLGLVFPDYIFCLTFVKHINNTNTLPRDILQPEIEAPTFWFVGDLFNLLSSSYWLLSFIFSGNFITVC